MAEGSNNSEERKDDEAEQTDNAWWKSWYTAAKSKSEEVFDYLKQDLTEISSTVKTEATSFISSTTTAITDGININNPEWSTATNSVKESVSSIITNVSKALNPPPLDGDEEPYIVQNDKVVSISKFQSKLYLLSADSNTYLRDIEENYHTRYSAWLESLKNYEFDPLSNESLTKLLLSNTRLKENYEKLVPEKVSHGEFWNRFLFRKAMLEDDEAEHHRRRNLEKKFCDTLEWEKESFGTHIALSDEEQGQILQEYEKELHSSSESPAKDSKSNFAATSCSEVSSIDRESSSDDWEKDFDIEDIPQNVN